MGSELAWTWRRFAELGVDDLYDALVLRCRGFVLEQGAFLDPDGLDRASWHLLGRDAAGALLAYLRVVDPGLRYAEPSIGRVVTAPEARRRGLGRALLGAWAAEIRPRAAASRGAGQGAREARGACHATSVQRRPAPGIAAARRVGPG